MKNKSLWIVTSMLFLCVLFVVSFYKYRDVFYVKKAHYCFKENNISCVQKNLEKAFNLGYDNFSEREMYLNTIINSPFDVKAQEKMYKFLSFDIDDGVTLKAQYFLNDLRKEINKKYEENYILQSVFHNKIMRWNNSNITYSIKALDNTPDYYKFEIENALSDWSRALNFQITFVESDKDPNIVINFNEHNPAETDEKKYVVAYTTPSVFNETVLKKMEINFYVRDPNGVFYSKNQVYNTALHEIAHALGVMGHSNDKKNIMYLTKDSVNVYDDLRDELTISDINTMKLLYKILPDITNVGEKSGEYLPYLVLGDDRDVVGAKLQEANLYIKRAPHLPNGYMDLAEVYASINEYQKAIRALERALNVADTDLVKEMVYYNLAVCYFYSKSYILAEDSVIRALEIKDSENSKFLLAEIYSKTENFEKATEIMSDLVKTKPKNIEYVIVLTNLYLKQKKYFKARKVLKTFVKNNPDERFNPRLDSYGILKQGL